MTLTPVTPVIQATQLLIRLNKRQCCGREEGLDLCNRLVEWISDSTHVDYHEAAMLVFFLAETLRRNGVISMEERGVVFEKGKDTIVGAKIDRVLAQFLSDRGFAVPDQNPYEKIISPVDEISQQLVDLRTKTKEEVACEGKPLFERLIQWISRVDPQEDDLDYNIATLIIFSIASHLIIRGVINQEEKNVMFNRAFQVIVRYPEHRIKNLELIKFLQQQGCKI